MADKDEQTQTAFAPYLNEGESLKYYAFGVKQPHIALISGLMVLAILPGIIATALLTKNYIIGITESRFIVIQIKGMGKFDQVKEITEYDLSELKNEKVVTKLGAIFTHIKIEDEQKPFVAKFHRAFSKNNKPHAEAIAQQISA